MKLAEIVKDQALKLAQLQQSTSTAKPEDPAAAQLMADGVTSVSVKVVGYIKKITIETVQPGLYDMASLSRGSNLFQTNQAMFWQRITF